MSACCLQCERGEPCRSPRIGGTRIGLPGSMVKIRVKPSIRRPGRGLNGMGASFWDSFAKDYKPGTFTNAFQAGFAGPAYVQQATSVPSFSLPYEPRMEVIDISGSTRVDDEGRSARAVASIQAQDFDIPIPVLAPGGSVVSSGRPSTARNTIIGAAVVGLGLFVFFKVRGKGKAPKAAAA